MKILFISECSKKSFTRTRRILSKYAFQYGRRTWFADLSQEGLSEVLEKLSKNASKNTSICVHVIKNNGEIKVVKRIGHKGAFNKEGIFSFSYTENNPLKEEWKKSVAWDVLKEVVVLAGLFHDLGKMTQAFQQKISPKKAKKAKADFIRHEFISYKILFDMLFTLGQSNDLDIFKSLSSEEDVKNAFKASADQVLSEAASKGDSWALNLINRDIDSTPSLSIINAVMYLVVSHHKSLEVGIDTPVQNDVQLSFLTQRFIHDVTDTERSAIKLMIRKKPVYEDSEWVSKVAHSAQKIQKLLSENAFIQSKEEDAAWVSLVVSAGRASLVLSDHYISSLKQPAEQVEKDKYYANSVKDSLGQYHLGQTLNEHLMKVGRTSGEIARQLAFFTEYGHLAGSIDKEDMPEAILKQSSLDSKYYWQDDAVQKIKNKHISGGFFGILSAKTGSGKTIGYTKFMNAFEGNVRFNLSLGLRSLTLQSGDVYTESLNFNRDQVVTLIGSDVSRKLHLMEKNQVHDEHQGTDAVSDDLEGLSLVGGVEALKDYTLLNTLSDKHKTLMATPIVISTVDYLVPSVEQKRTSDTALISRIATSDLILDEVDAYSKEDLVALTRLVYLTAFYGRKVILSSATIPPAIIESMGMAYLKGYRDYTLINKKPFDVHVGWISHLAKMTSIKQFDSYSLASKRLMADHLDVIDKTIEEMDKEPSKVRVGLLGVNSISDSLNYFNGTGFDQKEYGQYLEPVFDAIYEQALALHEVWRQHDSVSHKDVSVGVIRFSTVKQARAYMRYASNKSADEGKSECYFMCYHSKHAALIKAKMESFLDFALKGDDDAEKRQLFKSEVVREILDKRSKSDSVSLQIITTSIEEVGRDHDFDWCIMDPSSTRSVVQMAGRVRRHRSRVNGDENNFILLDTPIRSFINTVTGGKAPVFSYPGVETDSVYRSGVQKVADAYPLEDWMRKMDARHLLRDTDSAIITALEHRSLNDVLNDNLDSPIAKVMNKTQFRLHNDIAKKFPFRGKRTEGKLVFFFPEESLFGCWSVPNDINTVVDYSRYIECEEKLDSSKMIMNLSYSELFNESNLFENENAIQRASKLLGYDYQAYNNGEYKGLYFEENLGFSEK